MKGNRVNYGKRENMHRLTLWLTKEQYARCLFCRVFPDRDTAQDGLRTIIREHEEQSEPRRVGPHTHEVPEEDYMNADDYTLHLLAAVTDLSEAIDDLALKIEANNGALRPPNAEFNTKENENGR